jgi:hypothetical protein
MNAKSGVAIIAGLTASLAMVGCGETGVGPGPEMSVDEAGAIATFLVDADATGGWAAGAITAGTTTSNEFSRTVDCPAGGTRGVSGSGQSSFDPATRIASTSWSSIQFHDECTFVHQRGDRSVTVMIDGSIMVTGSATHLRPESRGEERVLLSYTSTRAGSTTTTVGDRSRTCEIDVTHTYDADSGSLHVVGVVCGREVDVTRIRREAPEA